MREHSQVCVRWTSTQYHGLSGSNGRSQCVHRGGVPRVSESRGSLQKGQLADQGWPHSGHSSGSSFDRSTICAAVLRL